MFSVPKTFGSPRISWREQQIFTLIFHVAYICIRCTIFHYTWTRMQWYNYPRNVTDVSKGGWTVGSGTIEPTKLAFVAVNQLIGVDTNRYCCFRLFLNEISLCGQFFRNYCANSVVSIACVAWLVVAN